MGLIKWFRREKIRRGARKEIKHARESAAGTRQVNAHWRGRSRKSGQRQTRKLTSTAENSGFSFGKNGKVPPFAYKAKGEGQPPK